MIFLKFLEKVIVVNLLAEVTEHHCDEVELFSATDAIDPFTELSSILKHVDRSVVLNLVTLHIARLDCGALNTANKIMYCKIDNSLCRPRKLLEKLLDIDVINLLVSDGETVDIVSGCPIFRCTVKAFDLV